MTRKRFFIVLLYYSTFANKQEETNLCPMRFDKSIITAFWSSLKPFEVTKPKTVICVWQQPYCGICYDPIYTVFETLLNLQNAVKYMELFRITNISRKSFVLFGIINILMKLTHTFNKSISQMTAHFQMGNCHQK